MTTKALAFTLSLALLPVSQSLAAGLSVGRLKPSKNEPGVYLIDGHYIRNEKLLLQMRKRGELPDTLVAGKCHYDLAGDTGVAYYVRTCD